VRLRNEETLLRPEVFGELLLRKDESPLELMEWMLRKDEILLWTEDLLDWFELMLSLPALPVSARFRPDRGLGMLVELMRLRLGDDVPSLKKELVRLRFGEDVPDLKKEELLWLRFDDEDEDVPDLNKEELLRLRFCEDPPDPQIEDPMRLRAGVDAPDLSPSSGREGRRSSLLDLFRSWWSWPTLSIALAKLVLFKSCKLSGCLLSQIGGVIGAAKISAQVGDRGLGMGFCVLWREVGLTDLALWREVELTDLDVAALWGSRVVELKVAKIWASW
jgi:hypothetical protein